jgi:hypothetical protein
VVKKERPTEVPFFANKKRFFLKSFGMMAGLAPKKNNYYEN